MSSLTSNYPATVTALLTRFEAAGLDPVDGPYVSGDYREAMVFVGYDGDPEGEFRSADTEQEWVGLGAKTRDETFAIACAVVATIGEPDVARVRGLAFTAMGVVETTLRGDPSLGQSPPFVAEIKPRGVWTYESSGGLQCRVPFDVLVKARVRSAP